MTSSLPWLPEVFLACGGREFSQADTSSAVGRSREKNLWHGAVLFTIPVDLWAFLSDYIYANQIGRLQLWSYGPAREEMSEMGFQLQKLTEAFAGVNTTPVNKVLNPKSALSCRVCGASVANGGYYSLTSDTAEKLSICSRISSLFGVEENLSVGRVFFARSAFGALNALRLRWKSCRPSSLDILKISFCGRRKERRRDPSVAQVRLVLAWKSRAVRQVL